MSLGIGRRTSFIIGYAAVAALVILALSALLRASDVLANSPNIDEAHIVSRLAYIWIASATVAAIVVFVNHLKWFRKISRWLVIQLSAVIALTAIALIWAKQTPQQPVRMLHVGDQPYAVPRVFDPRRGEQGGQRFFDVSLCRIPVSQGFTGIYDAKCTDPSDPVQMVLRPLGVLDSAALAIDLDRLNIPHLSDKILDVPNTTDIDKFLSDGYRGFSFRNIYLQHIVMDEDGTVLLHARCDSKTDRCIVTRNTDLGSLTFEIPGDGALALQNWKDSADLVLTLFQSWRCETNDCNKKLAEAALSYSVSI